MDIKEILRTVDHTLLKTSSNIEDIRKLCYEGIKYNTASLCIPPSFVEYAKNYTNNQIPICTVIGFPNGYNTTRTKVFETIEALENGADEIDMVVNMGMIKSESYDKTLNEIMEIKNACKDKILKVIIETCLLSDDEIIKMCNIVSKSGADFIKTSTGFSTSGATFDNIKLIRKHVAPHVKIKAAGGISSLEDAEKFISLGADRLGTSRIIKLITENNIL